jgi:ribonuclease HII
MAFRAYYIWIWSFMLDFSIEDGVGLPFAATIAGVDEVGRGPLAGPVMAVALVLDRVRCPTTLMAEIDDSKRLSAARRRRLDTELRAVSVVGLGWAEREEIDRLNILGATMLAMTRAVEELSLALKTAPDFALVDGNRSPPLDCPVQTVIKGDALSLSIAAASIVAKVARDAAMTDLAARFPGYGWERNAGYGTREHLDALERLGPTPEHRRSFAPVRAAFEARSESS